MWYRSFRKTNAIFKDYKADMLLMVISILVALFLAPFDVFGWGATIRSELVVYGFYSLSVFGVLYLLMLLFNYVSEFNEEQRLIRVTKLGEYRTEGVALRNHGMILQDGDEVADWIREYNDWHRRTLSEYRLVNSARAELWNTLDRFDLQVFGAVVNEQHAKFLNVLNTKLERLWKDIEYLLCNMEK
jgi:hypothetical protein